MSFVLSYCMSQECEGPLWHDGPVECQWAMLELFIVALLKLIQMQQLIHHHRSPGPASPDELKSPHPRRKFSDRTTPTADSTLSDESDSDTEKVADKFIGDPQYAHPQGVLERTLRVTRGMYEPATVVQLCQDWNNWQVGSPDAS